MRRSLLACAISLPFKSSSLSTIQRLNCLLSFRALTNTRTFHDYNDKMARDKDKGSGANISLKVPKGTRDWQGSDVVLREKVFATIAEVFKFVLSTRNNIAKKLTE